MTLSAAALGIFLCALVAAILRLEKWPTLEPLFRYLPAPFWCYFVPVTLATFGLLPRQSPVYAFLTTNVLCACLWLLLLNANLPAIARVGPTALAAMLVGVLGIGLGAVIAYALVGRWLPADAWKGVGALSASWTGGSANMLAVKGILGMSDSALAPFVIIDTVMTYLWMGLMIALAGRQSKWDAWVKADDRALRDTLARLAQSAEGARARAESPLHARLLQVTAVLALGLAVAWLCLRVAAAIPYKGSVLSDAGWAFILASIFGIAASFTPARSLEAYGASGVGYFCLYLLLSAIGARARFQDVLQVPALFALAAILVAVHAACLAVYGKLRRVPMFFLVTSSQANIGGTASAPIVAGIYQPPLASLGLLLAVGANVFGTYIGLAIAQACRWARP